MFFKFSDLFKLQKVFARILSISVQFVFKVQEFAFTMCTVDQPNVNDCLNRDEIKRATAVIVRVVQIDSFFDLYKELMRYR